MLQSLALAHTCNKSNQTGKTYRGCFLEISKQQPWSSLISGPYFNAVYCSIWICIRANKVVSQEKQTVYMRTKQRAVSVCGCTRVCRVCVCARLYSVQTNCDLVQDLCVSMEASRPWAFAVCFFCMCVSVFIYAQSEVRELNTCFLMLGCY